MPFQILNLSNDEFIKDDSGALIIFETGADAFNYSREQSEKTGIKHQPRRVETDANLWMQRERARFETGFYNEPSWIQSYHSYVEIDPNLFVHVSKIDPSKIAFTQNADKGVADIQTQIRVGAFLRDHGKFTANVSSIDRTIESIVLHHAKTYAPVIYKLATSPDEIEKIYTNGPNSCMAHPASCYASSIHPVRVYGDSDLSLAYLWNDETERATARVLVWPNQKLYGRVYGDAERLESALQKDGYKSGLLDGARIRRIVNESPRSHLFVLPYIDGAGAVREIDSDWLAIDSSGPINACTTNGLQDDGVECDRCGDSVDERTLSEVYTRRHSSAYWCPDCRDENTFYCDRVDAYISDSRSAVVDGEMVAEWILEDEAAFCEYSEEYTFERTVTVFVGDDDRQTWRESIAIENAFRCRIDGSWHHNDLMIIDDWNENPRSALNEPNDAPVDETETESESI